MRAVNQLLLAVLLSVMVMGCVSSTDPGSGTQTTNNPFVSGFVVSSSEKVLTGYAFSLMKDGSKQRLCRRNISVDILSDSYQPYDYQGFHISISLDASGAFVLDSLPEGNYNLFLEDSLNGNTVMFQSVPVMPTVNQFISSQLFCPNGFIGGVVTDTSSPGRQIAPLIRAVFILGSPFFIVVDSAGRFSMSDVPQGSYTVNAGCFMKTAETAYEPTIVRPAQSSKAQPLGVCVAADSVSILNIKF